MKLKKNFGRIALLYFIAIYAGVTLFPSAVVFIKDLVSRDLIEPTLYWIIIFSLIYYIKE